MQAPRHGVALGREPERGQGAELCRLSGTGWHWEANPEGFKGPSRGAELCCRLPGAGDPSLAGSGVLDAAAAPAL